MFRSFFCNSSFLKAAVSLLLLGAPGLALAQAVPSDLSLHSGDTQILPPAKVTAVVGGNYVEVSWNNVADDLVSEYHIFRYDNSNPSGTLSDIGIVARRSSNPKVQIKYKDYTIEAAKAYTYFVTSKTSFGAQSNNSNIAQVATPGRIAAPSQSGRR